MKYHDILKWDVGEDIELAMKNRNNTGHQCSVDELDVNRENLQTADFAGNILFKNTKKRNVIVDK